MLKVLYQDCSRRIWVLRCNLQNWSQTSSNCLPTLTAWTWLPRFVLCPHWPEHSHLTWEQVSHTLVYSWLDVNGVSFTAVSTVLFFKDSDEKTNFQSRTHTKHAKRQAFTDIFELPLDHRFPMQRNDNEELGNCCTDKYLTRFFPNTACIQSGEYEMQNSV